DYRLSTERAVEEECSHQSQAHRPDYAPEGVGTGHEDDIPEVGIGYDRLVVVQPDKPALGRSEQLGIGQAEHKALVDGVGLEDHQVQQGDHDEQVWQELGSSGMPPTRW